MWRCIKDYWCYCESKPEFGRKAHPLSENTAFVVNTCRLSPETCGRHKTLSELLVGKPLPTSSFRVVKGRVVRKRGND